MLPAAERLAEIPGVSLKLAREIIAETGPEMTRFPTADHLVSWAGLAPVARQSGPRQRKPSNGQGDIDRKPYRAQAANGTGNTGTFPGERLRRLTRRLGGTKAMCAVAGSIQVIIWRLLADPRGQVHRPRPRLARQQAGRDRRIGSHLRQLKTLGVDVTVTPAA